MKRLLPILITFLLLTGAHSAYAAIAFDAATSGGVGVTTFSHTTSGSNRLLIVEVEQGVTETVTNVKYAGVALTKVSWTNNGTSPDRSQSLWYLINPASGANNVVIGDGASNGSVASSYTGVSQVSFPDSTNTAKSGATSASSFPISTTVVASNAWLVAGGVSPNNIGVSSGAVRGSNGGGGQGFIVDSNGTVGTGSQSLTPTDTPGPAFWGVIIVSLAPVVAVATPVSILSLVKSFWIF